MEQGDEIQAKTSISLSSHARGRMHKVTGSGYLEESLDTKRNGEDGATWKRKCSYATVKRVGQIATQCGGWLWTGAAR